MELLHEISELIFHRLFPSGRIDFDWTHIMLLSILFFAFKGWKNGWQKGLVTLVALFLAWGIAERTTDFLMLQFDEQLGLKFGDEMSGFFGLVLYIASAVMVSTTANRVIGGKVQMPEKILGSITGLISGYVFIVLFLNIGHDWLANHIEVAAVRLPIHLPLSTTFTNNPSEVYSLSSGWQNVILFLLVVIFLQTSISQLWSMTDKLRPKK